MNLKIGAFRRVIIGTEPCVYIYGAFYGVDLDGIDDSGWRTIIIKIDACLATRVVIRDTIPRRIGDDEVPVVAGEGILGEGGDGLAAADGEKMLDDTRESLVEEGVDICAGRCGECSVAVHSGTHCLFLMDDILDVVVFSRKREECL